MRVGDNTDDILTRLLNSFLENYEREKNILRNGSNYVCDCIDLTLVELRRGSWYIPPPEWIEKKKATINPKNIRDNYCFAYSTVAALHHHNIGHHPERTNKIEPFISTYNRKNINFPAGQKDWKTFERNKKDIALNIVFASSTEKKINVIRRSDYNHKRQHIIELLMNTDNQNNWYCLTTKSIKRLIRGVTSNHHGDFFCRNCMHLFRTDNKLKKHERLCLNKNYCEIVMPKQGKNILKFTSNEKSLHMPHII